MCNNPNNVICFKMVEERKLILVLTEYEGKSLNTINSQ